MMKNNVEKLIELIDTLQDRRYPTILLVQDDLSSVTKDDVATIARECSIKVIDYREDILSNPDNHIVLGAYLRSQFREWLKEQARFTGGIFVVNTDELISSWELSERKAFFNDFLHIESNSLNDPNRRAPILLLTRHSQDFAIPDLAHGQGLVFHPKDHEREVI